MAEYKLVEGFDFSDIVYEKRPVQPESVSIALRIECLYY